MIRVRAIIELFKDSRKTSFLSGYRPMFSFVPESKVSGKIELIDRRAFLPQEKGEVIINFISKEYLGDSFKSGKTFIFSEGGPPLGEGKILEILAE